MKLGKFTTHDDEWTPISPEAKDLVNKLLAYDPKARISAKDALQHDWITKYSVIEIDQKATQNTLTKLRNFCVSDRVGFDLQ